MSTDYRDASAKGYKNPTAQAAIARATNLGHMTVEDYKRLAPGKREQRFTIPGRFPGMNEYQNACRSHWRKGHNMKIEQQERVEWAIKLAHLKPFTQPVCIQILWIEENRRRDFDNITAASKWVLDALVKMGVIPGDGEKWVKGITHFRGLDRNKPRVVVEIWEA